jgi:SAM-dependent methyltransferase
MATISPNLLPPVRIDGGRFRELQVLERLRDYLPAGFEVFHNIALHTLSGGRDCYGEIDVAVLSPGGALLLMEVKAGAVVLRDGDIFKLYGGGESDVGRQSHLQRSAMLKRLQQAGLSTTVISCLVLPDYDLGDGQAISIPRDRIIDAPRYDGMVSMVQSWLDGAQGTPSREALRRLLLNQFRVTPDLEVMRDQLQGTVRRLSDGLATWVPRIESPSGVYRIQATAGSGKTQLALQLLDSACAAGLHASYVCYNRSLADHVRRLASPRADVVNFHELCVDHYRRAHGEPEFSPQSFQRMSDAYLAASDGFTASLDLLVIDEAQDFDAGWVESLCRRLKPGGRLYVLEDEAQRLYQHEGFELGEAVTIRCSDNFRSPRVLCDVINALALVTPPVRGLNPYPGEVPEIHTYASDEELLARTEAAVAALLARGFALADIAVVSGRGRERSALLNRVTIGPWQTRRFTGEYDRSGEPRWSKGELLVESVYRYKGQSAPAVVITEFDFAALDDAARRRLFVALTRAQMAAELVLSVQAERCLSSAFGA